MSEPVNTAAQAHAAATVMQSPFDIAAAARKLIVSLIAKQPAALIEIHGRDPADYVLFSSQKFGVTPLEGFFIYSVGRQKPEDWGQFTLDTMTELVAANKINIIPRCLVPLNPTEVIQDQNNMLRDIVHRERLFNTRYGEVLRYEVEFKKKAQDAVKQLEKQVLAAEKLMMNAKLHSDMWKDKATNWRLAYFIALRAAAADDVAPVVQAGALAEGVPFEEFWVIVSRELGMDN